MRSMKEWQTDQFRDQIREDDGKFFCPKCGALHEADDRYYRTGDVFPCLFCGETPVVQVLYDEETDSFRFSRTAVNRKKDQEKARRKEEKAIRRRMKAEHQVIMMQYAAQIEKMRRTPKKT